MDIQAMLATTPMIKFIASIVISSTLS